MWRTVAVFVSLFVSRTVFGDLSFGFDKTNISLCSELSGNSSFLIVRTENENSEKIKLEQNSVYNILVLFLECPGNEYLRILKPNLYQDDLWQFEVRENNSRDEKFVHIPIYSRMDRFKSSMENYWPAKNTASIWTATNRSMALQMSGYANGIQKYLNSLSTQSVKKILVCKIVFMHIFTSWEAFTGSQWCSMCWVWWFYTPDW